MPTANDETYLIWSDEHQGWWCPGGRGYTPRVSEAGRYSRASAMTICTNAIPGQAAREGMLLELPVRASDIAEMADAYAQQFGDNREPWM